MNYLKNVSYNAYEPLRDSIVALRLYTFCKT